MKIRTDFVTNSSSSSFTLMIRFDLTDGSCVRFDANGGSYESGRENYFDLDAIVKVSPKQLGTAESIDALIKLLTEGVVDGDYYGEEAETPVFDQSRPVKFQCYSEEDDAWIEKTVDAYDFIVEIREKIASMDQIAKITITGDEECGSDEYLRTYIYDRTNGKYTGSEVGYECEPEGNHGGDLEFNDLDTCEIEYESDDE